MNNKNSFDNIESKEKEKLIQTDLIDKTLTTLYRLEEFTNYEDKKIAKCIHILQNWKPKKKSN